MKLGGSKVRLHVRWCLLHHLAGIFPKNGEQNLEIELEADRVYTVKSGGDAVCDYVVQKYLDTEPYADLIGQSGSVIMQALKERVPGTLDNCNEKGLRESLVALREILELVSGQQVLGTSWWLWTCTRWSITKSGYTCS